MSTKSIATATVIVAIKQLILAVERRTAALGRCCPAIYEPREIDEGIKLVAEVQKDVDEAIVQLRNNTGERLGEYTDLEVAFIAHVWAGIWSDEHILRLDSTDVARICGVNNVEEMEPFIRSLLSGSSRLYRFLSINWQKERGQGYYTFSIHAPNVIHKLLFDKLSTEG